MTSIEVTIDLSAGTAQVSGPISNADNVQLVLKDYAEHVTNTSRVRVVRGCHDLIVGGTVTVSGDNGVCLLNTNSDAVKKLAEIMRCPSQAGVEIVVDDTDDESVKATGRALLLLNWVDVGGGGGGGGGTVPEGAVPITNIDELPSRYRESDMRNKINEIARVISGRAVAAALLLAPFALSGAGVNVYTAQKDQVWNDERIVTNVTFDAEGLVTSLEAATNYVDAATNALSASLLTKIEEAAEAATNHADEAVMELDEAFSNKIVAVSEESRSYTDSATNALAATIPVIDLDPYATKTWVEAKGYLTADSIDGVATKAWVGEQGFLTTVVLTPYATMDWVLGRNYVTASVTNGLASKSWVEAKGYATTGWVEGKGYVTESVTNGLAGKSWVMDRGFVTESITNDLASKGWVEAHNYATKSWIVDRAFVTKSVTNGLASIAWVNGKDYADKAWVEQKSYVTESVTNGLAGRDWVYGLGFVTESITNGLATRMWVEAKDYADKTWVDNKQYVTKSVTNGLAAKTWVTGLGYVTQSITNGLASRLWVESKDYADKSWVTDKGYVTKSVTNGLAAKTWVEQKGYLPSDSAKRTYATKDELDALKRMYADTNGVTRVWSEDGMTMTDGTGVVWNVTYSFVTNWVSLTNGITYTMNGAMNWIGDGIVTNADGDVGVGRIWEDAAMQGMYNFGLNGFGEYDTATPVGLSLVYSGGVTMKPDAFTGVVERVASFAFRSRVVTNAVGYVTGGGGGGSVVESEYNPGWAANADNSTDAASAQYAYESQKAHLDGDENNIVETYARKDELPSLAGQTFDFANNRVLYTALSNIIIRLGGTVTNFPDFQ